MNTDKRKWYVYLVRCADLSLYCGITTSLERRIHEHNFSRKGSKYTRSRRPVFLAWYKEVEDRSKASVLECQVKKMSKKKKEELVNKININDNSTGFIS